MRAGATKRARESQRGGELYIPLRFVAYTLLQCVSAEGDAELRLALS